MATRHDGGPVKQPPYTVEKQFACGRCGSGRGCSFVVIGPDDVPLGITFDDEADADEYAEALTGAYEAGMLKAREG